MNFSKKDKMKHFFIIPNIEKPETVAFSETLLQMIEELGGEAWIAESRSYDGERFVSAAEIPSDAEAIITLGGDGTIIQAARDTVRRSLPILGINMGTLGFLAETDRKDARSALDQLFSGKYFIEERMMLRGMVYRKEQLLYENLSLNDVVLMRSSGFRMVECDFCVNGELIKHYKGDGMILATPTGSTAYNLSAGGPIVMPSASMILATPLNPHTMLQRSIVLPDSVSVTLRVSGRSGQKVSVSFDGTVYQGLDCGDEIRVIKAENRVRLLKLQRDSFLEVLRTKLE